MLKADEMGTQVQLSEKRSFLDIPIFLREIYNCEVFMGNLFIF